LGSREIIAGKYRLDEAIGSGGWGLVYRGENTTLGKPVAVKILHQHWVNNEEKVARFRRESRAAAALRHPGICSVFDVGTTESGLPFYVMEFVTGQTLGSMIEKNGPLPVAQAVTLCTKICRAVAAAHGAGIIHRDLTSNNVMVKADGEPILLDFGLAKITDDMEEPSSLTASGTTLGSPAYMSPEQCMGQKLDARSDIYSLGCVLYEMLCGHPPFEGATIMATMHSHVTEALPALPKSIVVPANVQHALLRSLSKNPEQRQQSMLEFADELEGTKKSYKWWNRRKGVVAAVAGILCVGGASAAAWFYMNSRQAAPPPKVSPLSAIAPEKEADQAFATMRTLFLQRKYQQAQLYLDRLMQLCAGDAVPADKAARMLSLVAGSYQVLEMNDQATKAAKIAIERLKQFCKPTSPRLIEQQLALVNMLMQQGATTDRRLSDWAYPTPLLQADRLLAELRNTLANQKGMDRERDLVLGQTTNCLLLEHRFKKCLELGEPLLPKLEKTSEFDVESSNVYNCVAQASAYLGDRQKALQLYQQALTRTLGSGRPGAWGPSQIYGSIGHLFNSLGDSRTACMYFKKALAQYANEPANSPYRETLRRSLANASLRYGDTSEAYADYKARIRAGLVNAPPILHEALSPFEPAQAGVSSSHIYSARLNFDPAQIKTIPDLQNLEALSLAGTHVTDADIAKLGRLNKLKRLFLASTDITDGIADHLSQFPNLELLDVSVTPVGSRTARALSRLTHLRRLDASVTQFTDEDMLALAKSVSLKRLGLSETRVTDRGLRNLSSNKSLEELDLRELGAITDDGVAALANLPHLVSLELHHNLVKGAGLSKLSNLQYLYFVNPITDANAYGIANMPKLKTLWIVDMPATDETFSCLPKLTEIETLNLACTDITDKTINLLTQLPHLKRANLNHTGLTDAGLAHLSKCAGLDEVHVSQTAVHSLAPLGNLKNLKFLMATDDDINDRDMASLASLPQLQGIALDRSAVAPSAIRSLAASNALKVLSIREVALSEGDLRALSITPDGNKRTIKYSSHTIIRSAPTTAQSGAIGTQR
jgi:Leucine-rich repeat (LRR) protein